MSNYFRRLQGLYLNNMLLFQIGGILALLGLAMGVVLLLLRAGSEPEIATASSNREGTQQSNSTRNVIKGDPIRDLVEEIYTAHGGRARIELLRTLSRRGVLETGPEKIKAETVYLWKRPNLVSFRLDFNSATLKILYNGEESFELISRAGRELSLRPLEPMEARFRSHNANIVLPFFPFLSDRNQLSMAAPEEINGKICKVIQWSAPDQPVHLFKIDPDSSLVIQRERMPDPTLPEDTRVIRADFEDYTNVDGLMLPTIERVFIDGELVNSFIIEDFVVNPGILDTYFQPDFRQ